MEYGPNTLNWHEESPGTLQHFASVYSERAFRRIRDTYKRKHGLVMSFEQGDPLNPTSTGVAMVNVYQYDKDLVIYIEKSMGRLRNDPDNSGNEFVNFQPRNDWGAPVTTNVYPFYSYPPSNKLLDTYLSPIGYHAREYKDFMARKASKILEKYAASSKNIIIMSITEDEVSRATALLLAVELTIQDTKRDRNASPRIYPYILRSKAKGDLSLSQNGQKRKFITLDSKSGVTETKPVFSLPALWGKLKYEADFLLVEPTFWTEGAHSIVAKAINRGGADSPTQNGRDAIEAIALEIMKRTSESQKFLRGLEFQRPKTKLVDSSPEDSDEDTLETGKFLEVEFSGEDEHKN